MNDTDLVSDVGNSDIIAVTTEKEIEAFRNFRKFHEEIFPYPVALELRMREVLGWKIWAALIQSIFAIALSAMRTADMFYSVAVSSSYWLAVAEAAAAVGAVEGGIVIFAAIRAETQNAKEGTDVVVHAPLWQLWIGEGLGIMIAVVAGLGLTFKGLGLDASNFSWWLGVILGAGASLIAAISGEIIGTTLSGLSNARMIAGRAYKAEEKAWKENLYNKWKNSSERKIATGEMKVAAMSVGNQMLPRRRSSGGNRGAANNAIRTNIFSALDTFIAENPDAETIPGPSEISRNLNVAKSYASQVIHEWMDDRGFGEQAGLVA